MVHAFLRKLRTEDAPAAPARPAAPPPPERISRHSVAFAEFHKFIKAERGLRVLDLGPTSAANINYLVNLGHNVHNEDLLQASVDSSLRYKTQDGRAVMDVDDFYERNLNFKGARLDATLCWDVPDFLHEPLVRPLVERLRTAMNPGGMLLAFFHTGEGGAATPHYRYHIAGAEDLDRQVSARFRLQRVFQSRHIENLFAGFQSIKFFLARDAVREVLVVR